MRTVIEACKLLSFMELRWMVQIYIILASTILRVFRKRTILSPHIDQLYESPSMGWKVKAAMSNQCDSCRWFCITSQRIQIRLRPSWGTEGEEIVCVTGVLPLWRLGQAEAHLKVTVPSSWLVVRTWEWVERKPSTAACCGSCRSWFLPGDTGSLCLAIAYP